MDPMLDAFAEAAQGLCYQQPRIPVVSAVSGELAGPELASAQYWVQHVRAPVRFAAAVGALRGAGVS
jgi:acyl transferase domain-containing protein